jgi:hypothetical protein
MSHFDELDRTVQEAIQSGRIGQPVFVRLLAALNAADADPEATLLPLAAFAANWIGAAVERVYAVRSTGQNQASVLLEFRSGAAGVVSTLTAGAGGPVLDVLLLGNHGAIYHEGLALGEFTGPVPLVAVGPALGAAIVQSVRSGKPQAVALEDKR